MNDTGDASREDGSDPKVVSDYIKGLRGRVEEVLSKIDEAEKLTVKESVVAVRDQLNAYVSGLESLYTQASSSSLQGEEVEIPLEVVQYVDDGGNPDECMRHIMSAVLRESQRVHGKKHALEVFSSMATQQQYWMD